MVKVYAVCCSTLTDEEQLNAVMPKLDATRKARIMRLQNPQKRAQCATAGLLLTHLFGHDGQPPALTHGSHGKPYLIGENAPYFSLSHSGDWVFCAVADSEVGLDAQEFTPYRDKVAARWFTDGERAWITENPDEQFAVLWAKKEAYGKFTGFGLSLPPNSFTVPCHADGWDEDNHCCWREYFHPAEPPIAVAVCCEKDDSFDEIVELKWNTIL